MSVHLIAFDKQPGVYLVGVGEPWRRHSDKCVIKVTGTEATNKWHIGHLYAGTNAIIDDPVCGAQDIWDANSWMKRMLSKRSFSLE